MAVPDYQSVMLPLLKFAAQKGTETSTSEAVEALAKRLRLNEDDLKEMLPSGIQSTFVNRVGWASTYMKKAGLLEATRRGFYQVTERGMDLLNNQPKTINVKLLNQYPEFIEFKQLKGTRKGEKDPDLKGASDLSTATPSEALEAAYENLRDELADELLAKQKKYRQPFLNALLWNCLSKWVTVVHALMLARQSAGAAMVE
jgi:restriction system protein